jgi:hypothetical protein
MVTQTIDSKVLRLRIVSLAEVRLHEETDPERVRRLYNAITDSGVLRNPAIVAAHPTGTYVVLDGATRTTALGQAECADTIVQIVDYHQQITLESWHHVLSARASAAAVKWAQQSPDVQTTMCTYREATQRLRQQEPHQRSIVALLVSQKGATVIETSNDVFGASRGLINAYGGYGEIHRIVHSQLRSTVQNSSQNEMVAVYPVYTPNEILSSALDRNLLPAGITRHVIPGRALNIGVHLHLLQSKSPLQEKNAWLEQWLQQKILQKKARYYHEPVFLFDD